jgi:hypothetical protein
MNAIQLAKKLMEEAAHPVKIWCPDTESWEEVTGYTIDPVNNEIKLYADDIA